MLRFLYGLVCLVCLAIFGGSVAGWVYSDRASGLGESRTKVYRNYQYDARHMHGVLTLTATPGAADGAGAFHPVDESAATTQPADAAPRWRFGQAAFNVAPTSAGKMYYAQAPYWMIAAASAVPLLIWLGLPKKRRLHLCNACQAKLRGSPAHCRACGQGFVVAQY